MRPLSATLRAAQQSASVEPYLRVRLFDRDVGAIRLRWQRLYTGTEPAGPCAVAVPADGSLLRTRIDPATGALTRQRVSSPGPSSNFTNWSSVTTVDATPRSGLAAAGTRALIASVRTDNVSVEVRESSNSGASFPVSQGVATAAAAITAVAIALQADGSAAVLYASGGTVYSVSRSGIGAWGAPVAWSQSLATVNALAAFFEVDYNVLVSGTNAAGDAGVWSTILGVGGAVPPGTWLALSEVAAAAANTSTSYLASGVTRADAPQAAFVESYSGGGAYDRSHLAPGVGGTVYSDQQWRDPRPFAHASAHGLGAAASPTEAWLSSPDGVWHAPLSGVASELSADVLEATLEQQRERGRLRLLLRNDDGRYAAANAPVALAPGGELEVEPGYRTSAGLESSEGPRFWISAVRRRAGPNAPGGATVEVEAIDGWGLLEAWAASKQLVWEAGDRSAIELLAAVARRAGLQLTALGASSESSALQPAFTVRAGERGATAVRRLLRALPDQLLMHGRLPVLFEPAAGDPVDCAYGGDHPIEALALEAGRPAAGWARVFGDGLFAEATDDAALAEGAGALIAVDDNLDVQARADARATTLLRQSRLAVARGELLVRPNVAQEVGDVVSLTDAAAGLSAAPFRIAGLRLRFARGGPRPAYTQTLTLSEV